MRLTIKTERAVSGPVAAVETRAPRNSRNTYLRTNEHRPRSGGSITEETEEEEEGDDRTMEVEVEGDL